MLEININVPEVKEFINDLAKTPGNFLKKFRADLNKGVGNYLTSLMKAEFNFYLGRSRYERVNGAGSVNYRNGSYNRRFTLKGLGEVSVCVPRDRKGEYKTGVLPRYKRYDESIRGDLCMMYLSGVSTRTLSMISKRLLGRTLSHEEVSRANKQLIEAVEEWRTRDLSTTLIKYIFLDGVLFDMRINKKIEKVPVLVAVGVTADKQKLVLGLQSGDKESASSWRQFLKDLKKRGLSGRSVTLGVMDGLPGLEKVFREEFHNSKTQRCQFHVAGNVLAKVTKKQKKEVADDMRSIFYASSRKKADQFRNEFKKKWNNEFPSAVKTLENSVESCLTYLSFPEDEWISLRTTNIIERLNKEFKRRTKPMEILAGENAAYLLLCFVAYKLELNWKCMPFGKSNLPVLSQFTQYA